MNISKKISVLVMTPALSGGSWISLEEPINELVNEFQFIVAGLGSVRHKRGELLSFHMPYFDYVKVGLVISKNPLFILLYEFPLLLLSLLLMILYRPKIIIGNGFATTLPIAVLAKLMDCKIICSFHGCLEYYLSDIVKNIIRALSRFVDKVVVNSDGGKVDVLSTIKNPHKIIVVKHWAHDLFFSIKEGDRSAIRKSMGLSDKFVLSYVGRIDREKFIPTLIKVIERLSLYGAFNDFHFIFVGIGELADQIRELDRKYNNVKYVGYIGDRIRLRKFYTVADIVWSFADSTYIARPAVEALACGTPIMLPDAPAVLNKAVQNVRIDHDLMPKGVGWIVNKDDIKGISGLVLEIKRGKGVDDTMRTRCRSYAKSNHSMKNFEIVAEILNQLARI